MASAIAFYFSGDPELAKRIAVSATYGFVSITLLAVAPGLLLSFTWAPFSTWRDTAAKIPAPDVLENGFTLKPNTTIPAALDFAVSGKWDGLAANTDDYLNALFRALEDFTQIASEGHIHVWYRKYRDAPWQRLEKATWHSHKLEMLDLLDKKVVLRRRRDGSAVDSCCAMAVCREEWDKRWSYYRSRVH